MAKMASASKKLVRGVGFSADVWGAAYVERPHYLRLYMARLRQKLESNPTEPLYFMTETGVGYRLKV